MNIGNCVYQQGAYLAEHLDRVRELIEELEEAGGKQLGRIHLEYKEYESPRQKGQEATAGYRMRMLTLELWEKWQKLRLYLEHPEFGLDGTDNCSERAIGKSKMRYKTMRGYKSVNGMLNGICVTQWLYSGDEEHDLAEELAA